MSQRTETAVLILIIGFWVVAALAFASGPLFEGPDELEHYRYIHYLAANGSLPPPDGQMLGEYHQAPLYYLINAPILSLLGSPSPDAFGLRLNPAYAYQIGATGSDNKNKYLHPAALETAPEAQAARALRLVPLLFGVGTILVTQRTAKLIFPSSAALRLLTTAVAALTPQFAFLSAVINNDSLLIFIATLALYWLLRCQRDGLNARRAAVLGALGGALLLTKTNAVFFGVVPLALFLRNRAWWRYLPVTALAAVLVGGWWFGYNLLAYHDPFLMGALETTWPSDTVPVTQRTASLLLSRLPYSYSTVWARFGSGAVAVSPFVDGVRNFVVSIGALGLIVGGARWLRRRQPVAYWPVVILFVLSWMLTLLYRILSAWSGAQGRYLLPGLAGWAALIAAAIGVLIPPRLRPAVVTALIGVLAASLGVSAFADFPAAYRPAPPSAPELALNYRYGDAALLLGASPAVLHARPGDVIYETLNWQALDTPSRSLKTFVHSIPPDAPIDQRDSYPGTGNLLSEDWLPSMTWGERYVMQVQPDAAPQQVIDLIAGLYDDATLAALDAQQNGQPVTPFVTKVVIHGETAPLPAAFAARYGDAIGLESASVAADVDRVTVCMDWRALRDGQSDLRRYVHVFDAAGAFVAQNDGDPRGGAYPARYWWQGETVRDCTTIAYVGATSISIGWYDPATGARLPAVDANGAPLRDNEYRVEVK